MAERRKVEKKEPVHGHYFASGSEKGLPFISSGCSVLDEVMGGGYVLGRIANIVGDRSSGKTLLAIEAAANFVRSYPKARVRYVEAEAAFDDRYAQELGMPIENVDFGDDIFTIEDVFRDIEKTLEKLGNEPCLYVVDSWDSLSDESEQERDIGENTMGMNKAKKSGELFRRMVQKIEKSRMLIIIISQIREKIGVTFGETKTRSGGKALDFYATHIIWLAEIEKLKKVVEKVERVVGIKVRANCKKNKVGLPFRQCDFPLLFGYGIDDLTAGVEWLIQVGSKASLEELGISEAGYKVRIGTLRNKGGEEVTQFREKLRACVSREWSRIELNFLPKAKKY